MCRARIRAPEEWQGDYLGMLGAPRIGERELRTLGEEVGWDVFDGPRAIGSTTARSESCAGIRRLPAGQHIARDRHDPLPLASLENGVELRGHGGPSSPPSGSIEIDLRNNPDCLPCGLNLTRVDRDHGSAHRCVQQCRSHVAPQQRQRTCRQRATARELLRGNPGPPSELLNGHLRHR